MKINNITDHIKHLVANDVIVFSEDPVQYHFAKESNLFVMCFDENAVVTKITDGKDFYAMKSYLHLINLEYERIYSNEILVNYNPHNYFLKKHTLAIDYEVELKLQVLVCPWIEEAPFTNCKIRYVEQLHNNESNINYRKKRRRTKAIVLAILSIFMTLIAATKINFPNEIYINPIDYKKLIVADSIKTIELAQNKNKKDTRFNDSINEKTQFIKESKNEVLSILIPEPVKVDKPKVIIPVRKKSVEIKQNTEKKTGPKKMKEVTEKDIKIIHSKSKVDFKSTEF